MTKQIEVTLSNDQNVSDAYILDLKEYSKVDAFTGRVFIANDFIGISFSTTELKEHSFAYFTWQDKTYYYFLTSKTMENSNVYNYSYVLDVKTTYRDEFENSMLNRITLDSLIACPSADVNYPTKQVSEEIIYQPDIDKSIIINTSQAVDAAGKVVSACPCYNAFGIQYSFESFILDTATGITLYENTIKGNRITFNGSVSFYYYFSDKDNGRKTVYFNQVVPSYFPGVKIISGNTGIIPAYTTTIGFTTEYSSMITFDIEVGETRVSFDKNNNMSVSGTTFKSIYRSFTTQYDNYVTNIETSGSPTIEYAIYKTSTVASSFAAMNATINKLIDSKRKILSVQLMYTDSFKQDVDQATGLAYITKIEDKTFTVELSEGFAPDTLNLYGNMIDLLKQLSDDKTVDITCSYNHDPNSPSCHAFIDYGNIKSKNNIVSVNIQCSMPYSTTAMQEYSLYNSQSLALHEQSKSAINEQHRIQKVQNGVNLGLGIAMAAAQTVSYGIKDVLSGDKFTSSSGAVFETGPTNVKGFTFKGHGLIGATQSIISGATGLITADAQKRAQIANMDANYRLQMQQIKDHPSNTVFGTNLTMALFSSSMSLSVYRNEFFNPEVNDFIKEFGVPVQMRYQAPSNKGFLSTKVLPNKLPVAVNSLFEAQSSFYYDNLSYIANEFIATFKDSTGNVSTEAKFVNGLYTNVDGLELTDIAFIKSKELVKQLKNNKRIYVLSRTRKFMLDSSNTSIDANTDTITLANKITDSIACFGTNTNINNKLYYCTNPITFSFVLGTGNLELSEVQNNYANLAGRYFDFDGVYMTGTGAKYFNKAVLKSYLASYNQLELTQDGTDFTVILEGELI